MKTYSEMLSLATYKERLDYLRTNGYVSDRTFGAERYINQALYRSLEWRISRRKIIARDMGCDLALPDRPLMGHLIVHHINPLTIKDIEEGTDALFDPNNLVLTCLETHNQIHYGVASSMEALSGERCAGDTCPWK